MKILLSYISVLITLILMDSIWLGIITKNFYQKHLGNLLRDDIVWGVVVLFYLLYAAAIVYFVVIQSEGSWLKALINGAILGGVAYMTYDLVNMATLKGWSTQIVIADIAWGIFITAVSAIVTTLLIKF